MSKIAFFTEMGFKGRVPRTHPNMRTEFAWMCALGAAHYHISQHPEEVYDHSIFIIPKKNPDVFRIDQIDRDRYGKIWIMQEGPNWYFQDYPVESQIKYWQNLAGADGILVHNEKDARYYLGLMGDHHNDKTIRVLNTLMIEDAIPMLPEVERQDLIIGGNMVSWYGGFDSFALAQGVIPSSVRIFAPSMGRKQEGEEALIRHLPYMTWDKWMLKLNEFKYAVHLMRTQAAGTFALNCSYLGIPCIGYRGLDTQELCQPNLSVDVGDLVAARDLMRRLVNDSGFYYAMGVEAKSNYQEHYNETKWREKFTTILS